MFYFILLGRERSGIARRTNIAQSIGTELAAPYYRTNRSITMDNFFTSYDLVHLLKVNGFTSVGTLRKNKKVIPPQFQANRRRAVGENLFAYRPFITISSYVQKQNKSILFLSSYHRNPKVIDGKSTINLFYNQTKGGVDVLDKLCHTYSAQRTTNRWSNALFMNMVNVAGVAAFVIHRNINNVTGEV